MFDKMKQMMELKKQADQIKRALDDLVLEVEEVEGIKMRVTGSQNFRSIEINEELLDPAKKEKFESDLLRSLNAALKKSQDEAAQKMRGALPGFPGL